MKKKLLTFLAAAAVFAAALLPIGIGKAYALSYYPGYSCYYRDTAGRCLNYQTSQPAYLGSYYGGTYRTPYGNRQTYPFKAMFNAYSTHKSPWDNRYTINKYYRSVNPYYRAYRYEEDDDDNDYLDEDDDAYDYYYGDDDDDGHGDWRWYYDEDDDHVRPYRYQSDDDDGYYYDHRYDDDDDYFRKYDDDDDYYDYQHTRYYCTGRDCSYKRY